MSQHPSLRSKAKGTKFRSVLKRFERLRNLIEKEKWSDAMSIFGLPKLKVFRFKIKKEKAVPEEAAAEAGAELAPEGAAATPGAKEKEAETGKKPKAPPEGGKKETAPKKKGT